MEKLNFVKNGIIRLPPGFRFHPTDEELILQYLRRKVYSFPLPASIIPDVDVCKSDPWDLPGDLEQERYFFSTRSAARSGKGEGEVEGRRGVAAVAAKEEGGQRHGRLEDFTS